jgi:RecB family exonuclease
VVDYKTGKSAKYADTAQLELMALMVFKHFPAVRRVKAGLLFVVANDFKRAEYDKTQEKNYWRTWMQDIHRLETAYKTGVWNPNPSGLCRKHCVVVSCPHNGVNK